MNTQVTTQQRVAGLGPAVTFESSGATAHSLRPGVIEGAQMLSHGDAYVKVCGERLVDSALEHLPEDAAPHRPMLEKEIADAFDYAVIAERFTVGYGREPQLEELRSRLQSLVPSVVQRHPSLTGNSLTLLQHHVRRAWFAGIRASTMARKQFG